MFPYDLIEMNLLYYVFCAVCNHELCFHNACVPFVTLRIYAHKIAVYAKSIIIHSRFSSKFYQNKY